MSALADSHNNGSCLSPCNLCDIEDAHKYQCQGCGRLVNPDEEPSPAEPRYCGDCHWHAAKEEARRAQR